MIGSGFGLRVAWGSGFRSFGFWVLRPGFRVQGFLRSGFGVWDFWGLRFTLGVTTRIKGLVLGLIGSGFGLRVVWDLGFRGFGFGGLTTRI